MIPATAKTMGSRLIGVGIGRIGPRRRGRQRVAWGWPRQCRMAVMPTRNRRLLQPPSRFSWTLFAVTLAGLLARAPVAAGGDSVPQRFYDQLRWRFLGPHRGGWALCATGVPGAPHTFLFGAADGGVFRSDDAGLRWQPIFERYGSAAVGALVVAPSDPDVIWVGTGQVQQRWDLASGDGVYRSTDGGKTFENVGLRETRHIGRVWVDPRDAKVAVVAALGHVFGPNPERGVFRTEDGGRSWQHVLRRGDGTGAVPLAGDPAPAPAPYATRS